MIDPNLIIILTSVFSLTLVALLVAVLWIARAWMKEKTLGVQLSRDLALVQQKSDDAACRVAQLVAELKNAEDKIDKILHQKHQLEMEIVERNTVLEKERESFRERIQILGEAEEKLKDTFQSLSSQALKSNNSAFLELANATFEKLKIAAEGDLGLKEQAISELVKPINEGLKQFDARIHEMEKGRAAQMSTVSELVMNLTKANDLMRLETSHLVSALRVPNTRGQWGELQLRRTIEIAGMVKYCDFVEQNQIGAEDVTLRPDVIVHLPNRRKVVIDSKAPLAAYLEACETEDPEVKELKLQLHAKQLRDHLRRLSHKAYHEHLEDSPEFVVMFLPGEVFYSAALEQDPSLIEYGVDQKVLLATPTTLIALLKAVAYGWKNQEIAEKAGEISKIGKDLYESVVKMLEHMGNVRKHLNHTVHAFNQTIRSTDRRLLPRIRKFKSLNAGTDKPIPSNELIETHLDTVEPPQLEEDDEVGDYHDTEF